MDFLKPNLVVLFTLSETFNELWWNLKLWFLNSHCTLKGTTRQQATFLTRMPRSYTSLQLDGVARNFHSCYLHRYGRSRNLSCLDPFIFPSFYAREEKNHLVWAGIKPRSCCLTSNCSNQLTMPPSTRWDYPLDCFIPTHTSHDEPWQRYDTFLPRVIFNFAFLQYLKTTPPWWRRTKVCGWWILFGKKTFLIFLFLNLFIDPIKSLRTLWTVKLEFIFCT